VQRWGTGPRRGSRTPSVEGVQRRLRALTARSWTPESIERATGVPAVVVSRALNTTTSSRPTWPTPLPEVMTVCGTASHHAPPSTNARPPTPPARTPNGVAGRHRWPGTTTRSTCRTGSQHQAGNPASAPTGEPAIFLKTPGSFVSTAATLTRPPGKSRTGWGLPATCCPMPTPVPAFTRAARPNPKLKPDRYRKDHTMFSDRCDDRGHCPQKGQPCGVAHSYGHGRGQRPAVLPSSPYPNGSGGRR